MSASDAQQGAGASQAPQGGRRRRSLFRPCIDLHQGVVKQIVGGTLRDDPAEEQAQAASAAQSSAALKTNHTSTLPPEHFAELYRKHDLRGAHVIKLGPKNDEAATAALSAWPGGLQVGGGIDASNAGVWLNERRASKVIVTSYLFPSCAFSAERLAEVERACGGRERLVVDVSCRRRGGAWVVAMNKWQDLTDMSVDDASLDALAEHCSEFLVHAADVEGLCQGIDEDLVRFLARWLAAFRERTGRTDFVVTYAGGARHIGDMQLVDRLSDGLVDLTFGSALDIFGGSGVTLDELVQWNKGGEA